MTTQVIPANLTRVVVYLSEVAQKFPLRGSEPHPRNEKNVTVLGYDVKVQFALRLTGLRKFWFLTMACVDKEQRLPEDVVALVRYAFFTKQDYIELPSVSQQGMVRQFIQAADCCTQTAEKIA